MHCDHCVYGATFILTATRPSGPAIRFPGGHDFEIKDPEESSEEVDPKTRRSRVRTTEKLGAGLGCVTRIGAGNHWSTILAIENKHIRHDSNEGK